MTSQAETFRRGQVLKVLFTLRLLSEFLPHSLTLLEVLWWQTTTWNAQLPWVKSLISIFGHCWKLKLFFEMLRIISLKQSVTFWVFRLFRTSCFVDFFFFKTAEKRIQYEAVVKVHVLYSSNVTLCFTTFQKEYYNIILCTALCLFDGFRHYFNRMSFIYSKLYPQTKYDFCYGLISCSVKDENTSMLINYNQMFKYMRYLLVLLALLTLILCTFTCSE